MELKYCRKCDTHKPFAAFSKTKDSKDGLYYKCKACRNAAHKERYAQDAETYRAKSREWDARNYEKRLTMNQSWRDRNPEKVIAAKLAYRSTRRPGANSPAEYLAKWRAENKGRIAVYDRLRRAGMKQARPAWANLDLIEVVYACAAAYTQATGVRHQVDHIVPLKSPIVCGLHVAGNLQILTADDNLRKGNRRWPDMPE